VAYNLGILAVRLDEPELGAEEFTTIVEMGRVHAPRHYASALYRYGRTLLQMARREEGATVLFKKTFRLDVGASIEIGKNAFVQCGGCDMYLTGDVTCDGHLIVDGRLYLSGNIIGSGTVQYGELSVSGGSIAGTIEQIDM